MARLPWNLDAWPATDMERLSSVSPGGLATTTVDGTFDVSGLSEAATYDLIASSENWTMSEVGGLRMLAPAESLRIEMHRKVYVDLRALFGRTAAGEIPTVFYSIPKGLHPLRTPLDAIRGPGATFRVDPTMEPLEGVTLRYTADSLFAGRASGQIELETGVLAAGRASETQPCGEVDLIAVFGNGAPFTGRLPLAAWRTGSSAVPSTLLLDFEGGRLPAALELPVGEYVVRPSMASSLETNAWTPFEGSRRFSVTPARHSFELSLQGCPCNVAVLSPVGTRLLGAYLKVMRPNSPRPSDYVWFSWRGSPAAPTARVWLSPGLSRIVASVPTLGMAQVDVVAGQDGEELATQLRLVEGRDYDPLENQRRAGARR